MDTLAATPPAPRAETLPDGRVRIHFASPIPLHAEPRAFVTLRLPRVMEVMEIGDPVEILVNEAAALRAINRPVLVQWFRLLVEDHSADVIGREADTALGLLIEETVAGFFRRARTALTPPSAPSSAPASA